jgi:tetratricopeptide (TPR) repeat protein
MTFVTVLAIHMSWAQAADRQLPAEARTHFDSGLELYDRGDYEAAGSAFEAAIRIAPEFTDAHRWLYDLRTGPLGESRDSVLSEIETQLSLHPDSPMWHYLRGRLEGDLDGQRRWYHEAIELDPEYPWGHYAQAHMLWAEGRLGEADSAFLRALDADPRHVYSWFWMARMRAYDQGRLDEAIDGLERGVGLAPDFNFGSAQFHLERLLYRTLPIDSVAAYYAALVVSAEPEAQWFAYVGLGNALRNMRHYREAAQAYRAALTIHPRARWWSRTYYYMAESLYRAGEEPGAVAAYDSVLASDDSTAYYFRRARIFRDNLSQPERTGKAKILDVEYQSQFGLPTCAGTCVAMIMNYFGDETDAERVNRFVHKRLYGPTGHQDNIMRYPIRCGYIADWSHASLLGYLLDVIKGFDPDRLDELHSLIDGGIPVEIGVQGGEHAILVVGYDDRKGAVLVHNSQWVPYRNAFEEIPFGEFLAEWSTAVYTRFMIVPSSKKHDVPSWKVNPLLSQYPNDYTGLLLGTAVPRCGREPSLYNNAPDRYGAERDEAVSFGLSLDRFGHYQRLWVLTDHRFNDDVWRYEIGFSNQGFPLGSAPGVFRAFWEESLYGGSAMFEPFKSLYFGIEGHRVEGDGVRVYGLPWQEGTDICLRAAYTYGVFQGWLQDRGWQVGIELSGSARFLGSDYKYARGDLEVIKAFPLPLTSSIRLRQRVIWTEGGTPLQAKVLPGINIGFRNAGNRLEVGDRAALAGAELRKQILRSTPMHPAVPLIGKVFYDMAYAWRDETALDSVVLSDFWRSWGVGLEFGFFNLDVAFGAGGGATRRAEIYFNLIGINQVKVTPYLIGTGLQYN